MTLEALYVEQQQLLDLGLIVPQSNVATLDHSALVIEGVCRYTINTVVGVTYINTITTTL